MNACKLNFNMHAAVCCIQLASYITLVRNIECTTCLAIFNYE